MKSYSAYGLAIRSEIPLPDLPSTEGECDVIVRCGPGIAASLDSASPGRSFRAIAQGVELTWSEFASFQIIRGNEIVVNPVPGADELVIHHLLLGPVFGVLNHQRGRAIFHASAVALRQGGVAFMGSKGHGKSTQAAAMVRSGGKLLTDDVLALEERQDGLHIAPGVPFLKLWPDTLAHIGEDPLAHSPVKHNLAKRLLKKQPEFARQPVQLKAVFILDHGSALEILRLAPHEALTRLLPQWYGALFDGDLLPVLGFQSQFWDCTKVVQHAAVYLLRRPAGLELLPDICREIEGLV